MTFYLNRIFPNTHIYFQGFLVGALFILLPLWGNLGVEGTLANIFGAEPRVGLGFHMWTVAMAIGQMLLVSKYLAWKGICDTNNVFYSVFIIIPSLMLFEIPWVFLYDFFHGSPQGAWSLLFNGWGKPYFYWHNVVVQDFVYPVFGFAIAWFFVRMFKPKFRLNRVAVVLWLIVGVSWVFWVFYPFPTVTAHSALFPNEPMGSLFPQFYYVWRSPTTWMIVDDCLIHDLGVLAVNMFVKFLTFVASTYMFLFEPRGRGGKGEAEKIVS